jgi:hypothetical protein
MIKLIGTVLLAVACVSGCIIGGHDVEPRIPTFGKKIAVIPFREKDLYYYESRVGMQMATLVTQVIVKEAFDMKVVNPAPSEPLVRDRDPDKIDWGGIAKKLKADYVLTGHIVLFRAKDPRKDVGFFRGEMVIQIKVWRADNTIAMMETVKAKHPSDRFDVPVVVEMDATEEEILGRLKAQTAIKIGKFFYAHDVEDH